MGNNGFIENPVLISVKNLKKHFPLKKGVLLRKYAHVKAVDGIDMSICKGETVGLVGESGCGKSTLGMLLLRLLDPTDGEIFFEGRNIIAYTSAQLRAMRKDMQVVFQDPYSSLNPKKSIRRIVGEPFIVHKLGDRKEMDRKVAELLEVVGIRREYIDRYPHEFSGGQRQRIGIARALVVNPKLVICDEPVSALDVSIQAQILNLLQDLQEQFSLTYLFISHDLNVVKHICDRILVMYLGRLVEIANNTQLYDTPLHPYTRALLAATPQIDASDSLDSSDTSGCKKKLILAGDVPSPINPPSGCHFHTRCEHVMDMCSRKMPQLRQVKENQHVRCFLYE
jgi:oligopeptide transport system ATP-binding protein